MNLYVSLLQDKKVNHFQISTALLMHFFLSLIESWVTSEEFSLVSFPSYCGKQVRIILLLENRGSFCVTKRTTVGSSCTNFKQKPNKARGSLWGHPKPSCGLFLYISEWVHTKVILSFVFQFSPSPRPPNLERHQWHWIKTCILQIHWLSFSEGFINREKEGKEVYCPIYTRDKNFL